MTLLVNSLEAGVGVMPPAAADGIRVSSTPPWRSSPRRHRRVRHSIAGSESRFAMTPYGEWHTRELELFVELLGMDDHDALLCMTRNAARAMPRHGERRRRRSSPASSPTCSSSTASPTTTSASSPTATRLRVVKGGVDVAAQPDCAGRARRLGSSAPGSTPTPLYERSATRGTAYEHVAARRAADARRARRAPSSPARRRASGSAIADRLAEAGAAVVVADRDAGAARRAARRSPPRPRAARRGRPRSTSPTRPR